MDYFSQLLESYSKLKKRTFKLTYINEGAADIVVSQEAMNLARQYISNPPEISNANERESVQTVNNLKGEPTGVRVYRNLNTGKVVGYPFNNGATIAFIDEKGKENLGHIKQLASALASDEKQSETEKTAIDSANQRAETIKQDAEAQEAAARSAGAAISQTSSPDAALFMQKSAEHIQKMLSADWFKGQLNDPRSSLAAYTPESIQTFIDPTNPESFEFKLANGHSLIQNERGEYTLGEISKTLKEDVAEANSILMSMLSDDLTDEVCSKLEGKVARFKTKSGDVSNSKIVLFGSNRKEGVVVDSNPIQKLALERFEQSAKCKEAGSVLEEVNAGEVKDNKLNYYRGTLDENLLAYIINLRNPDPQVKAKGGQLLLDFMKRNRALLERMVFSIDSRGNVAKDLDTVGTQEASREIISYLDQSSPLFRSFLAQTLSFYSTFNTVLENPDEAESTAKDIYAKQIQSESGVKKSADTGAKGDVKLVYYDRDTAERVAKKFGIEVKQILNTKRKKTVYTLNISKKFVVKAEKGKTGEIKTVDRMKLYMAGGDDLSKDLVAKIDERLFTSPKEALQATQYFNSVDEESRRLSDTLIRDQSIVDAVNNKIKNISAKDSCKKLIALLKEKTGYTATDKEISNLIKGDYDLAVNQERLADFIYRRTLLGKLKKGVDSKDPIAMKALTKMAVMGGMAKDSSVTIMNDEDQNIHAYNSNRYYEALLDQTSRGEYPRFDFTSGQVNLVANVDGKAVKGGMKLEGMGGETRDTRFTYFISSEGLKTLNVFESKPKTRTKRSSPAPVNADTLYQFLNGQMRLLETLLKKPNSNHLQ